jgi:hypothetical protein
MNHYTNSVRGRIMAATALTGCILACLVWFLQRGPDAADNAVSLEQPTNGDQFERPGPTAGVETTTETNSIVETSGQSHQPQASISGPEKTTLVQPQIEASVRAMNGAIAFWGCVVDEDGNAIAGAKVSLSYRTWHAQPLDMNASQTRTELVADHAGRIQLSGATGDRLTVESVEKPGYLPSPKAKKTFAFANSPELFSPDPNAPVVIRMWKQGQREPTVSREGFYGFRPDGRVYTVDLLSSKNIEGDTGQGDLQVRITRPENVKPREKYPWRLEVAAVGGGLVQAKDEFLFQAPEIGYSPALEVEMDPAEASWTSVLKKSLYLQSRGGKVYGAIQMTIRPNYSNGSSIQTESVLNVNGSRNLQP